MAYKKRGEIDYGNFLCDGGLIAATIYHTVTDNSNNFKVADGMLVIVGSVLEAVFGHTVGLIIIVILFAWWVFA